jgi:hypothetical protein
MSTSYKIFFTDSNLIKDCIPSGFNHIDGLESLRGPSMSMPTKPIFNDIEENYSLMEVMGNAHYQFVATRKQSNG